MSGVSDVYARVREEFEKLVRNHQIGGEPVYCEVLAKGFVGKAPARDDMVYFEMPSSDYALVRGKEVLLRCRFRDAWGDAFTDEPKRYRGTVEEVIRLPFTSSSARAVFFATLNAVCSSLGLVSGGVHCKEGDPERCGEKLVEHLRAQFGKEVTVAHIGYQPGHVGALGKSFKTLVTDLDPENIGKVKSGVPILDGGENESVIQKADVVCITGSALVNGTFPELLEWARRYSTTVLVYGVSAIGACRLLNLPFFCPYVRKSA